MNNHLESSPTFLPAAAIAHRDPALDVLRTLAVWLMIASHTTRLILRSERRDWSEFALLIEPMTASLFLLLVGCSLYYSWQKNLRAKIWCIRNVKRALALWLVSALFFVLENGFHWPDALLTSGILATIAYTTLIWGGLLLLPYSILSIPTLLIASIGLCLYLDKQHLQWYFVNAGNSPLLPLNIFAGAGLLFMMTRPWNKLWIYTLLLIFALLPLAACLHYHSFTDIFSDPLGRFETARILRSHAGPVTVEQSIPYYNLRPILIPMILSLTLLIYACAKIIFSLRYPLWQRVSHIILALGRHSLDIYILHLFILAMFIEISGLKKPFQHAWQGDTVILGIYLLCYVYALSKEHWVLQRKTKIKMSLSSSQQEHP